MKNLLTNILILTFLFLPITSSFAQTNGLDLDMGEDTEINIPEDLENENNDIEEETNDEKETLADTLEQKEIEQIQTQGRSFWTILGAILIPSVFLIICYFVLRFFQS
jgi:predicted PurR-regulated permease PerM